MLRFLPWLVLLLVSAVWGGSFAAIRYLVRYISPLDLMVVRFVPVTIITIVWILLVYRKSAAEFIPRFWPVILLISAIWLFGYHYALYVGETVLPASTGALIIATYPIFTIFMAAPILKEKLTWAKVIGGFAALAGTAYLTFYGAEVEGAKLNIEPMKWIMYSLLTLIAPIAAAVHTMIARPFLTGKNRHDVKVDPIVMTLLYMTPGGLFSIFFFRPELVGDLAAAPSMFWIVLAFLILGCTMFCYMGWFWALSRVEAGPSSIFTYIIPIFAIVYARIWLDEHIGLPTLVGAAGIIAGVVIAGVGGRNRRGSTAQAPLSGTKKEYG